MWLVSFFWLHEAAYSCLVLQPHSVEGRVLNPYQDKGQNSMHGGSPPHELYVTRATQRCVKIESNEEIRKDAGWSITFKSRKRPHCFKSVAAKSHWSTVVCKEKQSFWIHIRTIPLRDGFRLLVLLVLLSTTAAKQPLAHHFESIYPRSRNTCTEWR
jgi:hypothetical protein